MGPEMAVGVAIMAINVANPGVVDAASSATIVLNNGDVDLGVGAANTSAATRLIVGAGLKVTVVAMCAATMVSSTTPYVVVAASVATTIKVGVAIASWATTATLNTIATTTYKGVVAQNNIIKDNMEAKAVEEMHTTTTQHVGTRNQMTLHSRNKP